MPAFAGMTNGENKLTGSVMAGLVPAIKSLCSASAAGESMDVDARNECGHDG